MQKYVKNEKRYRVINFIFLLAVYKKLIGTGRLLSTRILRYDNRTTAGGGGWGLNYTMRQKFSNFFNPNFFHD